MQYLYNSLPIFLDILDPVGGTSCKDIEVDLPSYHIYFDLHHLLIYLLRFTVYAFSLLVFFFQIMTADEKSASFFVSNGLGVVYQQSSSPSR